MVKLEDVEFPSKYLNCYESVLVTILKHMGLSEKVLVTLMGTQAHFVLREDIYCVAPRFNRVDEEWERIHDLKVESLPITDEADLRGEIASRLDRDIPVCLPVDIYALPHTLHYNQLHQHHYVDIFGYDDGRYYMVCSYYRFRGWVDEELVHAGFFAAPEVREHVYMPPGVWDFEMRLPLDTPFLLYVPELKLCALSPDRVRDLVEKNCRYMLGLDVPQVLVDADPQCLGLAGVHTLSNLVRYAWSSQDGGLPHYILLNLSRQLMWVAFSRYWLCELIRAYQDDLLPAGGRNDLWGQFETVVQMWRTIGARLGSDAHTGDPELMERAAVGLEKAYKQEARLSITLLEALPGIERKAEVLESLHETYSAASLEDESQSTRRFVAPRTPTEEALAKIWAQVLEIERVGAYDNFFDLGGDSLLMARVHGRLQEAFGSDVSMLDLFKNPTISALARRLTQAQEETRAREHTQERGQKYRAALMQQRRRLRRPDR
jgi:acyl carrier protein